MDNTIGSLKRNMERQRLIANWYAKWFDCLPRCPQTANAPSVADFTTVSGCPLQPATRQPENPSNPIFRLPLTIPYSTKYSRSLHASISLGTTSDDRFMPKGYLAAFAAKDALVLTEKLDGQNNRLSRYGVFARSHAAPTQHPWDKPLIERWQRIKHDLGDLELFGENLYGIHSIAYRRLESYFYLFAVRQGGRWLGWDEVQFYAALFDFPTVPELPIHQPLRDVYRDGIDENRQLADWLTTNLGMSWLDYVETSGALGGYDPQTNAPCCEGLVIRNRDGFAPTTATCPCSPTNLTTCSNSSAPNTSKPMCIGQKHGSPPR